MTTNLLAEDRACGWPHPEPAWTSWTCTLPFDHPDRCRNDNNPYLQPWPGPGTRAAA